MLTEPNNIWPVDLFTLAIQSTVEFEIGRRAIMRDIKDYPRMSMRRDAVQRDVLKNWLTAAAPAANA